MPMPKIIKPFNYTMLSEKKAEMRIYQDVGYWGLTAEVFRQKYLMLDKDTTIDLRINSYGGEVFDGFAIFNTILENKSRFKSIVDGIAASISSYIPLGADVRVAHSNAMFMFHDPAVFIAGNSDDLRKEAKVLDQLRESLIARLMELMKGWSKKDILDMIHEETWYTAKEALDVGIISEIIDAIEVEEPETNIENKIPADLGKKVFINYKPVGLKPEPKKGDAVMAKCPSCQKENPDGFTMCGHCGKPMDAAIALKTASERERNEAVLAERNRVENIHAMCKKHSLDAAFIKTLIDSGKSEDQCAKEILMKIEPPAPIAPNINGTISVTKDESDKFIAHASNCLLVAGGIERDKEKIAEAKKDVPITSLHALMRIAMDKKGVPHSHLDANGLTDHTFRMIGTGSSDLPAALENVANKSLQTGYAEAPTTYQVWSGRREVTDFKTNSIIDVSNFGDLKDLPEGGAFEDSKISDKKETYSISTKGRKWTASRNALVNDDLSVFTTVQFKMGQAVGRGINKGFYDKLAATLVGPTMADAVALFNDTNHHNLVSTSGLVSVTTLSAARKKLREMPLLIPEPGAQTQYANLVGKYLVTGTNNEQAIEQVIGSGMDISKSIVGVYNPFTKQNTVLVCDPYLQSLLTGHSVANAWYYVADQMAAETIGVAYLRGQTSPTMRYEASKVGDPLGISYDIYFDWGFYVADHRGIIYNDGATGS